MRSYDEGERKVSNGKMLLESVFEKYLQNFPVEIDRDSFEFQAQFYYCIAGALGVIRYWMEHEFQEPPKQVAESTGNYCFREFRELSQQNKGRSYGLEEQRNGKYEEAYRGFCEAGTGDKSI